jgi:hypothetical protein
MDGPFLMLHHEKYGIDIEFLTIGDTDWNGSGMHNFSTSYPQVAAGYFEADEGVRDQPRHIAVCGGQPHAPDRQARRPVDTFSYGIAAARRSAFRTPSPTADTRAIWKTAARTRWATPTRSLRRS